MPPSALDPADRLLVVPAGPAQAERAAALCAELSAGLAFPVEIGSPEPALAEGALVLTVAGDGLRLAGALATGRAELHLDYAKGGLARRAKAARSSPLARALGPRKGEPVLDATAGLGRDTLTLAVLGPVVAVERHRLVLALLKDAWARAALDPALAEAADRVEIRPGDARDVLDERAFAAAVIDPMFPARGKTAAVKKEMALLHRVPGLADDDVDEEPARGLVEAALEALARRGQGAGGAPRVVVKRPARAEPLAPGPSHRYEGRGFRWDVYVVA